MSVLTPDRPGAGPDEPTRPIAVVVVDGPEPDADLDTDLAHDLDAHGAPTAGHDGEPDPRIAARRAAVRASTVRRVRRALVAVLSLVALGLVAWAALISPFLDIDRVVVLGAPDLDRARLARASGVRIGQATYSVDADQAARAVAALPEVAEVAARVRWPGELELRVTPRPVVARVVVDDETTLTVGRGGIVLDERGILPAPVPEVRVPSLGRLRPGQRLPDRVRAAVEVAASLPAPVRLRVSGAAIDEDGRLVLDRTEGGRILVGSVERIDQKMVTIETMLSGRVDVERLCLLDVRDPEAPVVRRSPDCDPPPPPEPVVAAPDPTATPGAAAPATGTPPAVAPAARDWGNPGAPEPEAGVEGT